LKILLIYNPQAGHGRAKKHLQEIESLFGYYNIDFDIALTGYRGHAVELVKSAQLDNYKAVVSAGGDGTLFETLNGIFKNTKSSEKPPLGIIPIGTGNAFVRDMELDNGKYKDAIEIIAEGHLRKTDVGKFITHGEEYYFLNIVGLGFVSDVAKLAHKLKVFGNFSYSLGVLIKMIPLKSYSLTIEIDGQIYKRDNLFVEISNSKYTSNFLMAPNAKTNDGYLDITLLNKTTRLKLLSYFPKIFTGEHIFVEDVETFKGKCISITTRENKELTPDGEILGVSPVNISCLHNAIEVFWR
jgi:YegS/Rv2252/BmrU family lipid kinase